jgi:hypothetical protein
MSADAGPVMPRATVPRAYSVDAVPLLFGSAYVVDSRAECKENERRTDHRRQTFA